MSGLGFVHGYALAKTTKYSRSKQHLQRSSKTTDVLHALTQKTIRGQIESSQKEIRMELESSHEKISSSISELQKRLIMCESLLKTLNASNSPASSKSPSPLRPPPIQVRPPPPPPPPPQHVAQPTPVSPPRTSPSPVKTPLLTFAPNSPSPVKSTELHFLTELKKRVEQRRRDTDSTAVQSSA